MTKEDKAVLDNLCDFLEDKSVILQHDAEFYAQWLKGLESKYQGIEAIPTGIETNAMAYATGLLFAYKEDKCARIIYNYLWRIGSFNDER